MGALEILVVLLGICVVVLNVMLFFKLWGMTNDIKELKNHFLK